MSYGGFSVIFKVDENLQNYLELYNWMTGLGFPSNFDQYREIDQRNSTDDSGLRSDISLIVLNSAHNANYEFVFESCYPSYLSGLTFDATDSNIDYITAEASFSFLLYEVKKIT